MGLTAHSPSGASPGRWHSGRGWASSVQRGNAFASPHPVCRACSFPPTRVQEAQHSGMCALRSALAGLSRSTGQDGQNWPVEGAIEWKFLLPFIHVGEDSCPARKETTSKQLEHPASLWQMFVMRLARFKPTRPFPSVLQSNVHTGSAALTQRRKLRPREVARLDADQT